MRWRDEAGCEGGRERRFREGMRLFASLGSVGSITFLGTF